MPTPVDVQLSRFELHHAAGVGLQRALKSWSRGDKDKHGYTGDSFAPHIVGAVAEYVVSKAVGRCWPFSVDTFTSEPDIAGGIEVRWSGTGRLIIRNQDIERHPNSRYVLVTGVGTTMRVWGWITPTEATKPVWLDAPKGRPPAYFVPTGSLHDLEQIRAT